MRSSLLSVQRLPKHEKHFYEMKDPSVVMISDQLGVGYTSIGQSETEKWRMGRFLIDGTTGQWKESNPVILKGLEGPQVCAPAVRYNAQNKKAPFEMYVQQWCFQENGAIHHATSQDGIHFNASKEPVITPAMFPQNHNIRGVYDVSITDINYQGCVQECMTYTGIRSVGDGDVYLSMRAKGSAAPWSAPHCIIRQEDVACHNQHEIHEREWCLEGMNLLQLSSDMILAIGVCFLPQGERGTRQRVVMLAASTPLGPYKLVGTPFDPSKDTGHAGENGHPDVIDFGDSAKIIYQARHGNGQPWHLREIEINKAALKHMASNTLCIADDKEYKSTRFTEGFRSAM